MPYPLEPIHEGDWAVIERMRAGLARDMNPPVPQARVFNSGNISIANNTVTTLTFDSERWDEGGLHSTSANTGRLTAPITGLYSIGCNVEYDTNATGARALRIALNGTTVIARDFRPPVAGGTFPTEINLSVDYRLAASEFVTVEAFQTSGGALNVVAIGNSSPEFWMHRVGGYVNQGV